MGSGLDLKISPLEFLYYHSAWKTVSITSRASVQTKTTHGFERVEYCEAVIARNQRTTLYRKR